VLFFPVLPPVSCKCGTLTRGHNQLHSAPQLPKKQLDSAPTVKPIALVLGRHARLHKPLTTSCWIHMSVDGDEDFGGLRPTLRQALPQPLKFDGRLRRHG